MKQYILLALLSSVLLSHCKPQTKQSEENQQYAAMDIYLCIGQSNMAGRGAIELEDQDSLDNVFLLTFENNKLWEKAANPMNKYSTVRKKLSMQRLSPSFYFGKAIANPMSDRNIGLVVNAKGGTSIQEWEPGSTLYNEAIRRTKTAMEHGELKGIIWHQGESNASKPDTYRGKLGELIEAIRSDLDRPNLPFVAGQLSPDKPARNTFNELILSLPDHVANTAVVTTENTTTTDKTHFDSHSQRVLGQRYADEMIKLLK